MAVASGPMTSLAITTSFPSSSLSRFATGARLSSDFHFPLGFPMWEQAITAAWLSSRYWMVGRAAWIRLSSVIVPLPSLAMGTLKSQRSNTFFPAAGTSVTVCLL